VRYQQCFQPPILAARMHAIQGNINRNSEALWLQPCIFSSASGDPQPTDAYGLIAGACKFHTVSLFLSQTFCTLMIVAQPLVPEAAYPVTAYQQPSRITRGLHKAEQVSGSQRALRAKHNRIYDIGSNWLYIKRVFPESVPRSLGVSRKGLSKRSLVMGPG
jgi:hypothetical protein